MSEYIWEEPAYRKPRKQSEPLADWFEVVRQLEAHPGQWLKLVNPYEKIGSITAVRSLISATLASAGLVEGQTVWVDFKAEIRSNKKENYVWLYIMALPLDEPTT